VLIAGALKLSQMNSCFFLENIVFTWCISNSLLLISLMNVGMLVKLLMFYATIEKFQMNTSWASAYQILAIACAQIVAINPSVTQFKIGNIIIGNLSLALVVLSSRTIDSVMQQLKAFQKSKVFSLNGEEYNKKLEKKLMHLRLIKVNVVVGYTMSAVVFLGLGLSPALYRSSEYALPILMFNSSILLLLSFVRVLMSKGGKRAPKSAENMAKRKSVIAPSSNSMASKPADM